MRRLRRAVVGVLSPRRALKLGKIRRRACLRLIPLPGTGDVRLAPTMISHPLAYVVPNPRQWELRTRGETLLPSREKVKEEEAGGGLSPPRFRWRWNTAEGHHHHRDLHQHLHHLPPSIFSGPLSCNPLYPLLEHGDLCFILLSNDVLPSYDV